MFKYQKDKSHKKCRPTVPDVQVPVYRNVTAKDAMKCLKYRDLSTGIE
jgi:hypothetical protein